MQHNPLAGPSLAVRQELFDFIETELQQREDKQYPAIRKLGKALHNRRDQRAMVSSGSTEKIRVGKQLSDYLWRGIVS